MYEDALQNRNVVSFRLSTKLLSPSTPNLFPSFRKLSLYTTLRQTNCLLIKSQYPLFQRYQNKIRFLFLLNSGDCQQTSSESGKSYLTLYIFFVLIMNSFHLTIIIEIDHSRPPTIPGCNHLS